MSDILKTIREWFEKDKTNRLQIGTIVTSILNFEKFSELNSDPDPKKFDPKISKWAPVDGRSISGSLLAQYTDEAKAADARGMFLRGLTTFDAFYNTPIDAERGVIEKNGPAGKYQPDAFQGHWHFLNGKLSTQDKPNKKPIILSAGDIDDGNMPVEPNFENHNYIKSPKSDGKNGEPRISSETRPRNIAVYFYIKIN